MHNISVQRSWVVQKTEVYGIRRLSLQKKNLYFESFQGPTVRAQQR